MTNIYEFQKPKNRNCIEKDLARLIKEAKKLQFFSEKINDSFVLISNFEEMQKMIEKEIYEILFERNYINSDYFLCGKYIATMITETVEKPPISWYAIDYLSQIESEKDYLIWKKAGDVCFLICSIFTGRANKGMMKPRDYALMGRNFYYLYYEKGKKEIGYIMSVKYNIMSEVTNKVFKPLL